jgi:hypothetical protein
MNLPFLILILILIRSCPVSRSERNKGIPLNVGRWMFPRSMGRGFLPDVAPIITSDHVSCYWALFPRQACFPRRVERWYGGGSKGGERGYAFHSHPV